MTGRNIRLLQLGSGSDDALLECQPIEASIDETPPYEALSYVWGDASITEPIVCIDEIVQITTNLANALRKVRSGIKKVPRHERSRYDRSIFCLYQQPSANGDLAISYLTMG